MLVEVMGGPGRCGLPLFLWDPVTCSYKLGGIHAAGVTDGNSLVLCSMFD